MRKMKKALAAVMAAAMVMGSMGVTAWATTTPNLGQSGETEITQPGTDGKYGDAYYVTFKKIYKAPWDLGSPEETFTFSVEEGAQVYDKETGNIVEKRIDENSEASYPDKLPQVESAAYEKNEASATGTEKTLKIELPTYTRVGVYYYTVRENVPGESGKMPTTGVTYYPDGIVLKVTVVEQNGLIRVGAVHCEKPATDETTGKIGQIENTYEASGLEIKKIVSGILGDQEAYFTVKLTLTAPANTEMKSEIKVNATELTYKKNMDDPDDAKCNPETITSMGEYTFKIKHNETIELSNIPKGVTYSLYEVEANQNDYKTSYDYSDKKETKTIDTQENDIVTITNNKGGNVDTGIVLDSLPYILLLAIAVGGILMFVLRKRNDDQF